LVAMRWNGVVDQQNYAGADCEEARGRNSNRLQFFGNFVGLTSEWKAST